MKIDAMRADANSSRTPQGVRGLKFRRVGQPAEDCCRTPQGVRGLKYPGPDSPARIDDVAPRKGCVD